MKIAYISGPFVGDGTKESIKKNIEKAREYANALASKRVGVFCSHIHDLDPTIQDLTERQRYFYELDSEFLIKSDAVVFIPGWEDSFGGRLEKKIADELGLPQFFPKSPENTTEIEKWYFQEESKEDVKKSVNWDNVIDIRRAMSKYIFNKATG